MKKSFIYVILALLLISTIGFGVYYFSKSNTNSSNPQPHRIGTETNIDSNSMNDNKVKSKDIPKETELSSFSTKILIDDDNRDTNLKITSSKINATVVKAGEEFSFNEVVGNPTKDKGYKKAGAFGKNGKKIKTYGGGNCQVSSTLYNAVLEAEGLKVTERHQHEREVGYIELGKDATIAYAYLDLKFKNDTGSDIKLYANVTEEKVEVRIVKLNNY